MKQWFTIPNLISYARVVLMFYAFWSFLLTNDRLNFLILTVIVIVFDGLDGIIARKINQATELGAKVDIFCDRLTELGYWYFFAHLGYLGIWVFWFFLLRGVVVDYLTRKSVKPLGDSWLRSSRFMRASYGSLKLLSFCLLIMVPFWTLAGVNIVLILVYLVVLLCFLRALPVILASLPNF